MLFARVVARIFVRRWRREQQRVRDPAYPEVSRFDPDDVRTAIDRIPILECVTAGVDVETMCDVPEQQTDPWLKHWVDLPAVIARERCIARTRRVRQSTGGGAPCVHYAAAAVHYAAFKMTPLPRQKLPSQTSERSAVHEAHRRERAPHATALLSAAQYKLCVCMRARESARCALRRRHWCFSALLVASSPSTPSVTFSP